MVVAVIGAGVIGSAVATSLTRRGCEEHVIAADLRVERLKELESVGVKLAADNKKAADLASTIILCVKPRDVANVLEEVRNEIKGKLVISVAAAVGLDYLKSLAPEARFVRAMPNIGILVQESFTAYCADEEVTSKDKAEVERLLGVLGKAVEVDEKHMDAITALSGCSPAYFSVMVEAMVQAGLEAGLPKDLALTASAQTMVGTGRLILEGRKEPSQIVSMVATPGGVTEEGLKELEKTLVGQAVMSAVRVGVAKSRKISQSLTQKEG